MHKLARTERGREGKRGKEDERLKELCAIIRLAADAILVEAFKYLSPADLRRSALSCRRLAGIIYRYGSILRTMAPRKTVHNFLSVAQPLFKAYYAALDAEELLEQRASKKTRAMRNQCHFLMNCIHLIVALTDGASSYGVVMPADWDVDQCMNYGGFHEKSGEVCINLNGLLLSGAKRARVRDCKVDGFYSSNECAILPVLPTVLRRLGEKPIRFVKGSTASPTDHLPIPHTYARFITALNPNAATEAEGTYGRYGTRWNEGLRFRFNKAEIERLLNEDYISHTSGACGRCGLWPRDSPCLKIESIWLANMYTKSPNLSLMSYTCGKGKKGAPMCYFCEQKAFILCQCKNIER